MIAKKREEMLEVSAQWVGLFRLWRRRGQKGLFLAAALCLAAVLTRLVVSHALGTGAARRRGVLGPRGPAKPAISYILYDPPAQPNWA